MITVFALNSQTPDCLPYLSYNLNKSIPSGHMTLIQQQLNVDETSWRCIDVEAMLY